jgi:hypothetical protein
MGTTTTLDEVVGVISDGYPREVAKCNVNQVLTAWSLQRPAFRVLCDAVFQVDERKCLVPDVSVIVSGKLHLYFSNGGKSFWTVYPEERLIRVENALGEGTRFDFDLPLVDPSVLPGFSVPTSAIFEGV